MSSFPVLVPFYGLASAFLFALSNHFSNMGLQRSDARAGTVVSIATSAGAYWLLAPCFVKSSYGVTTAAFIFAHHTTSTLDDARDREHQDDGTDAHKDVHGCERRSSARSSLSCCLASSCH